MNKMDLLQSKINSTIFQNLYDTVEIAAAPRGWGTGIIAGS